MMLWRHGIFSNAVVEVLAAKLISRPFRFLNWAVALQVLDPSSRLVKTTSCLGF